MLAARKKSSRLLPRRGLREGAADDDDSGGAVVVVAAASSSLRLRIGLGGGLGEEELAIFFSDRARDYGGRLIVSLVEVLLDKDSFLERLGLGFDARFWEGSELVVASSPLTTDFCLDDLGIALLLFLLPESFFRALFLGKGFGLIPVLWEQD